MNTLLRSSKKTKRSLCNSPSCILRIPLKILKAVSSAGGNITTFETELDFSSVFCLFLIKSTSSLMKNCDTFLSFHERCWIISVIAFVASSACASAHFKKSPEMHCLLNMKAISVLGNLRF